MDADLAAVAALMAEPNRARILQTLLGGRPQTGISLANETGISRSLASAHLKKLVEGRLVISRPRGRMRLYEIASYPVAEAIETLMMIAPPTARPASLSESARTRNLRWIRMCYDHLAGVVGVAISDALLTRSALKDTGDGWTLGEPSAFDEIGVDPVTLASRRPVVRSCPDWTEPRPHLAGSLGAAVAGTLAELGWTRRRDASRIVTITPEGAEGLRDWLGLDLAALRAALA